MSSSRVSTLDPELARPARRVPLCGRPKAKPLVEGAFIITRLSKREEKMRSLSMQERHARRYVEEALGIPVLGVFPDIRSGLQAERRAGYQEAMRRARLGLCSHIVVYDFDRFSRERVTSLRDYEDLGRFGIELHDTLTGHIAHDVAAEKAVAAESEARKPHGSLNVLCPSSSSPTKTQCKKPGLTQ